MQTLTVDCNLSIYDEKPSSEVSLDTLQEISVARLFVLRWIANQKSLKKPLIINSRNNIHPTKPTCSNNLPELYLLDILHEYKLLNNRESDILSHFICRLVFAELTEYTTWFINQEVSLFETKYILSSEYLQQIIISKLFNKKYPIYTQKDIILNDLNGRSPIPFFNFNCKSKLHNKLIQKYFPFYVIPFYECLKTDLISKKLIYIRNGYCFVPNFLFILFLNNKYSKYLKNKLNQTKYSLIKMKNDLNMRNQLKKIMYIIRGLNNVISPSSSSSSSSSSYSISNSNSNSNLIQMRHYNIHSYLHLFPLCMRYTYQSLISFGHLKNSSRLQLTLFLKGCGLPMEDSLIFFKKYFTKTRKSNVNFDLNYAYHIRYQYGKEGSLKDYKPFGCNKIIENSDKINDNMDHHGCPFKMWNKQVLNEFVKKYYNINNFKISNDNNNNGIDYQIQCKSLFNLLNNVKLNQCCMDIEDIYCDWNHPNKYFDIGRDLNDHNNEIEFKQKYQKNYKYKNNHDKPKATSMPLKIEYN